MKPIFYWNHSSLCHWPIVALSTFSISASVKVRWCKNLSGVGLGVCSTFSYIIPTPVLHCSWVVLVIALGSSVARYNLQSRRNTAGWVLISPSMILERNHIFVRFFFSKSFSPTIVVNVLQPGIFGLSLVSGWFVFTFRNVQVLNFTRLDAWTRLPLPQTGTARHTVLSLIIQKELKRIHRGCYVFAVSSHPPLHLQTALSTLHPVWTFTFENEPQLVEIPPFVCSQSHCWLHFFDIYVNATLFYSSCWQGFYVAIVKEAIIVVGFIYLIYDASPCLS